MNEQEKLVLNYPLFDGEKVIENASVTVENGTQGTLKSCSWSPI